MGLTSENEVLRYKSKTQPGGLSALGLSASFIWPYHHDYRAAAVFGAGVSGRRGDDLGHLAVPAPAGSCAATVGSERPDGIRVIPNCGRLGSSRQPSADGPDPVRDRWQLQRGRAPDDAVFHVRQGTLNTGFATATWVATARVAACRRSRSSRLTCSCPCRFSRNGASQLLSRTHKHLRRTPLPARQRPTSGRVGACARIRSLNGAETPTGMPE